MRQCRQSLINLSLCLYDTSDSVLLLVLFYLTLGLSISLCPFGLNVQCCCSFTVSKYANSPVFFLSLKISSVLCGFHSILYVRSFSLSTLCGTFRCCWCCFFFWFCWYRIYECLLLEYIAICFICCWLSCFLYLFRYYYCWNVVKWNKLFNWDEKIVYETTFESPECD